MQLKKLKQHGNNVILEYFVLSYYVYFHTIWCDMLQNSMLAYKIRIGKLAEEFF